MPKIAVELDSGEWYEIIVNLQMAWTHAKSEMERYGEEVKAEEPGSPRVKILEDMIAMRKMTINRIRNLIASIRDVVKQVGGSHIA